MRRPRDASIFARGRMPQSWWGGHSASGAAAFYGSKLFDFPVAGFIGLDPFPIQRREPLLIPALFWGFSVTTCGVSVQRAALAAYNQSMSGQRVMYQLQNSHRKKVPSNESSCHYSHCAFTDTGCLVICPLQCSTDSANDLRQDVAISLRLFLNVTNSSRLRHSFSRRGFADSDFHLDPRESILMIDQEGKQDQYSNHNISLMSL